MHVKGIRLDEIPGNALRSELRIADICPQGISHYWCSLEAKDWGLAQAELPFGRKSSQHILYWLCRSAATKLEIG